MNLKRTSADTGGTFEFRFSDDDGANYIGNSCNTGVHHTNSSSTTMSSGYVNENHSTCYLGGDGGRTEYGHMQLWIANLTYGEHNTYTSSYPRLNQDGATRMVGSHGSGHIGNASSSNNALKFQWSGGESITGRYTVYGLKD